MHPEPQSTVTSEKPALSFEQALSDLEGLVDTLEKGDLSLEDSLRKFERGIELTRLCQQALQEAEQKVRILTAKTTDAQLEPFDSED
jgi:exodeoxyribonuclease VII small subunit